jgi:hypothetical protein
MGVLLHDHGIAPLGQQPTGDDRAALPWTDDECGPVLDLHRAGDVQIDWVCLARAERVGGPHSVPVHRGPVVQGQVLSGFWSVGQHSAKRLVQWHGLYPSRRPEPAQQLVKSLFAHGLEKSLHPLLL